MPCPWFDKAEKADDTAFDRYIRMDLDHERINFPLQAYDYVFYSILLNILNPLMAFWTNLGPKMGIKKSIVLITVPNVAFFFVRIRFLFGHFQYGKRGILDFTHRRLSHSPRFGNCWSNAAITLWT